jgi:glycosyl transferase family 25
MTMLKVIVINLDKATERMAFQKKQLDTLGIKFSRLSANATDLQDNFEEYQCSWERPLSKSEVSVFFNHKKIWDEIISTNEPFVILEDDAYVAEDTVDILNEIKELKNIDYLNLESRGKNQRKLVAREATYKFTQVSLYRLFQGRSGAAGYVLWPSGACKLITQFEQGKIGLVDKFINANYHLIAYQCEPAPIIQLDMCQHYSLQPPLKTQSSINANVRSSKSSIKFWIDKVSRIKGQLIITFNYLCHINHSSKRAISISTYFK